MVPDKQSDDANVQSWCEAIMWMAARQIALSSEINTWKQLFNWFAEKVIRYKPSSYCG